MVYDSVNDAVLNLLPPTPGRVLDLGCGAGSMGKLLIETRGCRVTGVTVDPEEAAVARSRLDRVEVLDLNAPLPPLGTFDCILCSHVLEHLHRPDHLLYAVRGLIASGGCLVVALPNVLHWKQRVEFVRGRFRYTDGGLMDRSHVRFYDWRTARELLTGAGYRVIAQHADGGFPLSRLLPGPVRRWADPQALRWAPGLFGWQFVFRCEPTAA